MEFIQTLLENWAIWIVIAATIVFVFNSVQNWFSKPTKLQIEDLKEWLKFAVAEAERALGSGTGELKLRMVYDKALAKFPWLKTFVSFETFKKYVDDALEWLKKEIDENVAISEYIKGK